MSKKWYVLHTYSGYENKVKTNLETRIETMGLENNVFAIEIPTETVTEIKEGGRRKESEKKVFPVTCWFVWNSMIVAGLLFAILPVLPVLSAPIASPRRLLVTSTTRL